MQFIVVGISKRKTLEIKIFTFQYFNERLSAIENREGPL